MEPQHTRRAAAPPQARHGAAYWHRQIVRLRCRYYRQRLPRCHWSTDVRALRLMLGARPPTSAAAAASAASGPRTPG